MSRGQRPRTVAEFPRMKDRAAGRRLRRRPPVLDIVTYIRNLGRAFASALDRSVFGAFAAALRLGKRSGWRIDPNGVHEEVVQFVANELDLPIGTMRGPSASLRFIDEVWHDPTHGAIDREIQDAVDRNFPGIDIGRRVAIERTAQDRKDRGLTW